MERKPCSSLEEEEQGEWASSTSSGCGTSCSKEQRRCINVGDEGTITGEEEDIALSSFSIINETTSNNSSIYRQVSELCHLSAHRNEYKSRRDECPSWAVSTSTTAAAPGAAARNGPGPATGTPVPSPACSSFFLLSSSLI